MNVNFDCNIVDILNVLIAILGFALAIWQFWKQNKENRATTIDQNNKNWYLSVLVIPHLERINVFFDDVVKDLKELKSTANDNDLIIRAKDQGNYNERISAFITPMEAAMSSYDNDIRGSIANLCLALQDEVTKIISDDNLTPTDIETRVMNYKGKLIGILYKPIKGKDNQ